jgi:Histidine kinase
MRPMRCRAPRTSRNRVAALARVHRHLLDESNVAYIPALSYVRRLCADLADILGVSIEVSGDDVQLTTKAIQSVGLLLNDHCYSITASALARSASGITMPSAFAVLRLMFKATSVACSIGSSAGWAPLRMRST